MNNRAVRLALRILAGLLAVTFVFYLAICGYLYTHQREILFIADRMPPGPAPAGYIAQTVAVPGGGTVLTWRIAPATPGALTFVFFTGNAARIVDFAGTGEAFHARGFGVVLASYRGYSGNPGEPSEDGLMADARAVLASVHHRGKLIAWGHSLGSGVAAQMAAEHRADGLVLESPYTSIADVAAGRYWLFPVHWLIRDPFDTESLVPRIQVPVLIIHGSNDPVVPFEMGQTLVKEFGARASFVPVPYVGHVPHQIDLEPVVERWLLKTGLQ